LVVHGSRRTAHAADENRDHAADGSHGRAADGNRGRAADGNRRTARAADGSHGHAADGSHGRAADGNRRTARAADESHDRAAGGNRRTGHSRDAGRALTCALHHGNRSRGCRGLGSHGRPRRPRNRVRPLSPASRSLPAAGTSLTIARARQAPPSRGWGTVGALNPAAAAGNGAAGPAGHSTRRGNYDLATTGHPRPCHGRRNRYRENCYRTLAGRCAAATRPHPNRAEHRNREIRRTRQLT
jgi:hypothetical protein